MTQPRRGRGRPVRGGARRRRARPSWAGPVAALATVVAVLVVAWVGLRVVRADAALPGVAVAGIDVGGLDRAGVEAAVAALAAGRGNREIVATRDLDDGTTAQVSTSAADLGATLDVTATVDAVWARGRQANPLAALRDHLRAFLADTAVAPVEAVNPTRFAGWVGEIADALGLPPVEGDLRIAGGTVEVVPPGPGETVDAEALLAATTAALAGEAVPAIVEVPTTIAEPSTDAAALEALAAEAERAISAPVTIVRGAVEVTLTGEDIGRMLRVRLPAVSGTDEEEVAAPALRLVVDPDVLLALLPAEAFAGLTTEPQDARFELIGGQVQVVPAVDGFGLDADAAAEQVLQAATSPGPRRVSLEGRTVEADLTTAEAEALGITQEVATFTTEHPCCQSRVTNIQRIADLVDGVVVLPGETFSLNAHVGRRTTANGFVDGGAISGGEFVEQVGGGVSQFTTTMFNTIFFGGYEIVEFKPHSYYIPRYPLGREATLNFDPPVDLAFTNDSPHGIYVDTSHTDTSVTVTFWSSPWAEVTSTTGERYGFSEPREQREPTDELPAGEERVTQTGSRGFSVDFTRTIAYVDGREETQRFTTVYLAEPRIVLVGTGDPDASPSESPSPTASPDEPDPDQPDPDQPDPEPTVRPTSAPSTPPPAPAPPAPAPAPPAPPPPPPPPPPPEPDPEPTSEPAPTPLSPGGRRAPGPRA